MNKASLKLVFLFLYLAISSCKSTYYVVRHAEKDLSIANNPPLTEAGQQRAEKLKTMLADKKITRVFSTQTLRTESTAKPLAEAQNLKIESYDAKNQAVFIEQLKALKKTNVLIVGHSNSLRHVVNGLFEHDTLKKDLDETDYGNLFVVKRGSKTQMKALRF